MLESWQLRPPENAEEFGEAALAQKSAPEIIGSGEGGENMEREQLTIRLPEDLYNELIVISQQTGLTVTALLLLAIWRSVLQLKGRSL